jgi:hypothetical protein
VVKLPEGIGFTSEHFQNALYAFRKGGREMTIAEYCAEWANDLLPTLFEAWVRREGVKVYGNVDYGWWGQETQDKLSEDVCQDTHTGYVVMCEEIKK